MSAEVDEKCMDFDMANPLHMLGVIRELPYLGSCSNDFFSPLKKDASIFRLFCLWSGGENSDAEVILFNKHRQTGMNE